MKMQVLFQKLRATLNETAVDYLLPIIDRQAVFNDRKGLVFPESFPGGGTRGSYRGQFVSLLFQPDRRISAGGVTLKSFNARIWIS